MKAPLLALLAVMAMTTAAGAQAQPVLKLRADDSRPGRIALVLSGPPGAVIRVTEDADPVRRIARVRLDRSGSARLPGAAQWSCETRTRTFLAVGEAADGTALGDNARLVTPDCARRYRIRVAPRRARATKPVRVRVRDTFALGKPAGRVCARGPAGLRACEPLRDGRATLRLPRAGRWRVDARRAEPVRLEVARAPGPVTVLATGDSMIQIVDGFLSERLGTVLSDARISTGLSKPFMFNWPAHARSQVARLHPDATVMFIGANDGYPFGDTACCGKGWQRAYANRASAMMRTYVQDGGGTVYWCLLPAPRPSNFRRVFVAVNAAVRRAARRHRGTVRIVDLPRTFTPGFAFRQRITWRGRSVSVRQEDGIHLNVAGASIAASLIAARMRRDGLR